MVDIVSILDDVKLTDGFFVLRVMVVEIILVEVGEGCHLL